jgi:hypothetical protein
MPYVFVSYRREDTRADAGRIYDRLAGRFGHDHVFRDIDDIEPGQNFVRVLERTLDSCNVLIVLIGSRWLEPVKDGSPGRLAEPADFVRLEVEKALERAIPTIPELVGDAEMPTAHQLPTTIARLANLQALQVSDIRFHEDVDHLISVLDGIQGRRRARRSPSARKWGYLTAVLAVAVIAGLVFASRFRGEIPALRSEGGLVSSSAAKAMIARHAFYHRGWNSAGSGVSNDYALRVLGEAVVVVDGATRLMWQNAGSGVQMKYPGAQRFIGKLNAERFGGFADWRIPTLEEAMTLVEAEADLAGWYVDPIFERSAAPILWTSDRQDSERRWVVYLGDGLCSSEPAGYNAWVRAVRSLE